MEFGADVHVYLGMINHLSEIAAAFPGIWFIASFFNLIPSTSAQYLVLISKCQNV